VNKDVFEKPLTVKDFMKRGRKAETEKPKLYERIKKLPESKRRAEQSKYSELVNAIAEEKRGTYRVLLDAIKEGLTLKSAYSSIEKMLIQVAKRDGVNFSLISKRQVQTKNGVRTYVSYPEYTKWKEGNMKLRVVNNELFIEKRTDRPL
jgi:predicted polyphosphate/ATP-dependent NAD kinase